MRLVLHAVLAMLCCLPLVGVEHTTINARVDLGSSALQAASPYTNLTAVGAGTVVPLIGADGQAGPASLRIVAPFDGISDNGLLADQRFVEAAQRDSFYVGQGREAQIVIDGLPTSTSYTITCFASRAVDSPDRVSSYRIGGQRLNLDAHNNVDQVVTFTGIRPDAAGTITLSTSTAPGSIYAYLGAIAVESEPSTVTEQRVLVDFGSIASGAPFNDIATINASRDNLINDQGLSSGIGLHLDLPFAGLNGNGVDADDRYPSSAQRDSCWIHPGAPARINLTGLRPDRLYDLTFFASREVASADRATTYTVGGDSVTLDAQNNRDRVVTLSDRQPAADGHLSIDIATANGAAYGYLGVLEIVERAAGGGSHCIIDCGNLLASGALNNLTHGMNGLSDLIDSEGEATGIGLAVITPFDAAITAGVAAADVYPLEAQVDSLWVDTSAPANLRFTGLIPGGRYEVTCFASRQTDQNDRQTAYTIADQTLILDAQNNRDQRAVFPAVVADGSGAIDLAVATAPGASYGYLGVLELRQLDGGSGQTNQPPVITSHGGQEAVAITIAAGSTDVTTISASDAESPASDLSYSFDSVEGNLFSAAALADEHILRFNSPAAGSTIHVVVRVSDPAGAFDTQAFTITVRQNTAPVIAGSFDEAIEILSNETRVTTISASDDDGDPLSYSITGSDAGRFDQARLSNSQELAFAAPVAAGTYRATVVVSDGQDSDSVAITVLVTDAPTPNQAPVITSNDGADTAAISVTTTQLVIEQVTASDDGKPAGTLAFSLSGPDAAYFDGQRFATGEPGILAFVTSPAAGSYTITVSVSDGELADSQALTITVVDPDDVGASTLVQRATVNLVTLGHSLVNNNSGSILVRYDEWFAPQADDPTNLGWGGGWSDHTHGASGPSTTINGTVNIGNVVRLFALDNGKTCHAHFHGGFFIDDHLTGDLASRVSTLRSVHPTADPVYVITAPNFIQTTYNRSSNRYELITGATAGPPDQPYYSHQAPVDALVAFAQTVRSADPNATIYLYVNWTDLTVDGEADYHLWAQSDLPAWQAMQERYFAFNTVQTPALDGSQGTWIVWWEALAHQANELLGPGTVQVIPAGPLVMDLFGRSSVFADFPVESLFEDYAHGSGLLYYFAGLVHYMVIYGEKPTFSANVFPATSHSATTGSSSFPGYAWPTADDYDEQAIQQAIDYLWLRVQDYYTADDQGELRSDGVDYPAMRTMPNN